jgi:starch phosphorylase
VQPRFDELTRAADDLARRLPEPLHVLARLAYNYRWTWTPGGRELFDRVDAERWRLCGENPVRLLQEVSGATLERAAVDPGFVAAATAVERSIATELARPARPGVADPARPVAFFCAEYALHPSLPIYSGGLGALAGDFLKEASDLALPLVAVGLLYRQGYFRQRLDASGWQHEYWIDIDPERTPMALVTGDDGEPLLITVPLGEVELTAQIWRVGVGRVPLYLLDAERPENEEVARWVTSRLYTSDPELRLSQYVLLGVGGVRALAALGIDPTLIHLNEGHAAFAALELARMQTAADGGDPESGFAAARTRTLFTTHTPVPAGNDTYPADQVAGMLGGIATSLGVDPDVLVSRGRTHSDDVHEPFGVTQFTLRASRAANGVSRRHGEVAREMWHALWPERSVDEVPITHVTNGVHLPTWIGGPMRDLLDRHLGPDWWRAASDPATWAPLEQVTDEELWAARNLQRATLIAAARQRSVANRLSRGEPRDYAAAAARVLSPDAITIGFARRVATYKRLHLLLADPDRSLRLLAGERPVQLLIAGKAHPRDDDGKRLIQGLFALKQEPAFRDHVVFLEDYDLAIAAHLVQGCDVWVNVPRPPLEASGTSGMKSVANGGLQLSSLDGWWAEAYDGDNGWALSGEVDDDHWAQDARDGAEFLTLLEERVIPEFYDRDAAGRPTAWLARMRRSMRVLSPEFSAARMVSNYERELYRCDGG